MAMAGHNQSYSSVDSAIGGAAGSSHPVMPRRQLGDITNARLNAGGNARSSKEYRAAALARAKRALAPSARVKTYRKRPRFEMQHSLGFDMLVGEACSFLNPVSQISIVSH